MSTSTTRISSEEDLRQWVLKHKSLFQKGSLFLLKGNLGAGKTTLVSYVVEALGGSRRQVSSPTFSLHHTYQTPVVLIDHMDLYRLETEYDLSSSGFDEVLEDSENLAFIEWASKVDEAVYKSLAKKTYWIELSLSEDNRREIVLKPL